MRDARGERMHAIDIVPMIRAIYAVCDTLALRSTYVVSSTCAPYSIYVVYADHFIYSMRASNHSHNLGTIHRHLP